MVIVAKLSILYKITRVWLNSNNAQRSESQNKRLTTAIAQRIYAQRITHWIHLEPYTENICTLSLTIIDHLNNSYWSSEYQQISSSAQYTLWTGRGLLIFRWSIIVSGWSCTDTEYQSDVRKYGSCTWLPNLVFTCGHFDMQVMLFESLL